MKTKTLEKNAFEVKEGKKIIEVLDGTAIITVPHLEDKVSFAYPAFKGSYESVGKQIEENGLLKPTPEQTISLVYSAHQNLDNKYFKEIKDIMRNTWFWMFNKIKYVPNEGAFIQKPDKEVFVPFGYKIGKQSSLELSKNFFVIALFGEEGADKIARVADKYQDKPYLYSFENVDKEIVRKSALYGDVAWYFGDGLVVDGYGWGDDVNGRAFGVDALGKNLK